MKVKYVGMFEAVEVPEVRVTAKRGELVEVPSELGVRLLQQPDNWKVARETPERRPSGPAAKG